MRALCLAIGLTLVAAATLTALPNDADAKCARLYLQPYVVTPGGTVLPSDGGAIVVGLMGRMKRGSGNLLALPKTMEIAKGDERIELTLETLAPGFARAVPATPPSPGEWTVVGTLHRDPTSGGWRESTVTFGDGTLGAAPDAPDADAAELERTRRGRRMRVALRVGVGTPAPEGMIAVVGTWEDDGGQERASATAYEATGSQVYAYRSRSRCSGEPTGEVVPEVGAQLTIRFVAADGQVSPPSDPVKIGEATESSDGEPAHKADP